MFSCIQLNKAPLLTYGMVLSTPLMFKVGEQNLRIK